MKYFIYKGIDKIEIEADSVGVETVDGQQVELTYRKTTDSIQISTPDRLLNIQPQASNSIRVTTGKSL